MNTTEVLEVVEKHHTSRKVLKSAVIGVFVVAVDKLLQGVGISVDYTLLIPILYAIIYGADNYLKHNVLKKEIKKK